jgi:hypothetical protein
MAAQRLVQYWRFLGGVKCAEPVEGIARREHRHIRRQSLGHLDKYRPKIRARTTTASFMLYKSA